ncbi:MAG: ribonuclease Y [Candidatus Wildermuthbacteria bacterium]|nr:ribonuclease Y [Candidatus Wildermuthbacteria bacterium]MBI2648015.1 ribonuclease Y [Candidatus Wildermuthbacteria bacterium]
MDFNILVLAGLGGLGIIIGYYVRQSVALKQAGTVEQKLQTRISQVQREAEEIIEQARAKTREILASAKKEEDAQRQNLLKTEQLLLKRENILDKRLSDFEQKEQDLRSKVDRLREIEKTISNSQAEVMNKLEEISSLSKDEAQKEIFLRVEKEYEKDILARIKKLEAEGQERFEKRAQEIVSYVIQRTAVSQAQEITTTTVSLPSEDLKGKIIGKEGRNIRALERLTGVEIIVDETPETVVISGFDPVRRHTAKIVLERLLKDGRIHPARVEEEVAKAQQEIEQQVKEAGEAAVYDVGIVGFDPKLIHILGRLKFRTSYGQNVLMHSIEVAHLASALAAELGLNVSVAKKGGLLHDIGKALDHQVEGSHVEIGIRILEKFGVEKEVIDAMKSHHEDYPFASMEAIIVQSADAISGARPGARKDTIENYIKRIGELENLAGTFEGVEKAYAIQAGREIRVFVKPESVDDMQAQTIAKNIANRIQDELRYPGEIKVTLIRENRFVEYAR